jgi:hypothetical protein
VYEDLVNRLNSRSRAIRETAERQLATLSPSGLAEAARTALKLQKDRARRNRLIGSVGLIPLAMCMVFGCLYDNEHMQHLGTLLMWLMGVCGIWLYAPTRASRAVARTCRQVNEEQSSEVALALLESWAGREVKRAMPLISASMVFQSDAAQVILNGLNGLTTSQIAALSPSQVEAVAWLLKEPLADTKLTREALRVLALSGGRRELPMAQKVARIAATNTTRRAVSEAAQACVTSILLRLENDRNQDTLLRPAAVHESGRLLRPAASVPSEESQLVRPVDVS